MLYDPDEHRALAGAPWSDRAALSAIEQIVEDALGAYQGPERLWPNAAEDLEGDPDLPFRNAYFGAGGVAMLLQACLTGDPRFPFLDGALGPLP